MLHLAQQRLDTCIEHAGFLNHTGWQTSFLNLANIPDHYSGGI